MYLYDADTDINSNQILISMPVDGATLQKFDFDASFIAPSWFHD